jgi:outer membrane protein assembly factor BamD
MRAVSYYEQITDVGRDQAATAQAQAALREVISRYPDLRIRR